MLSGSPQTWTAGPPPPIPNAAACVAGTLWADHVPGQKKYQEHPKFHGKHTAAGALEHLQHIVLGNQPFFTKPYGQRRWCESFYPATHCPGSPCLQ